MVQLSKKGASGRHLTWFNDTFPFFGGVILSTQSGQIAWGAGCFEQRCTTEPSKWKGVLFGRSGTETRHRGRRPEKLGVESGERFRFRALEVVSYDFWSGSTPARTWLHILLGKDRR